jgi:hypothetical protein
MKSGICRGPLIRLFGKASAFGDPDFNFCNLLTEPMSASEILAPHFRN